MKNLLLKLFAILLIAVTSAHAQKEPDHVIELSSNVKDLVMIPATGTIVVSEGEQLHGFKPEDGSYMWTVQVKKRDLIGMALNFNQDAAMDMLSNLNPNAKAGALSVIPGTTYVKYFDDNNELTVINAVDGNIIYRSATEDVGISIYESEYIPSQNALLLKGFKKVLPDAEGVAAVMDAAEVAVPTDLYVALYNLDKKGRLWETNIPTNLFRQLGAAFDQSAVDMVQEVGGVILILEKRNMFALETNTGKVLWTDEILKTSRFYASLNGDRVLLEDVQGIFGAGGKSVLTFKNARTGEDIWEEPIKTKRLIIFEDWGEKMLLAHRKGFNFFDYSTGKKVWAKDPKGKNVKDVISTGKDFLYVYDDEVMLLGQNGQKLWKKDVKISDKDDEEVYYLKRTPSGAVLYVTQSRANMIDYMTGKKLWKGNLSLNDKRISFTTYNEESGNFVLFNDEKFYKFADGSDDKPKPLVKLRLKSEKLINSIDVFDNSIAVTGNVDVAGIDFNGNILYHNKYTQPGEGGRVAAKVGLKALGVSGDIAQTQVTVSVTYRDANGKEITNTSTAGFDSKTRKAGKLVSQAAGALGQNFASRFDGLQQDAKYALVFAKGENGEKLIYKVNKETGEEENKIEVESNKPIYDYDSVTGNLYYSRKKQVRIYLGS